MPNACTRLIGWVGLVTLPLLAYSQAVTTGMIAGTTKDQSGAAIPGVALTLTNTATGRVTAEVSDETGTFRFLSVPAGSGFQLKAELAGFKAFLVSDIAVRPGGSQRFDVSLEVGQLAEEVTVTAEAPLVNSESAQVVEALGERITASLPLLRRDFTEVAVLFQGIQHSARDDSGFFVQYHARGMPTTSSGYRVDGAQVVTPYLGRVGSRMTKTAIEQYEFIAGGFSAEYGEQPGSVVNLTTKSGKNEMFFDYGMLYKPEALTSEIKSGLANQAFPKSKGYTHFQEFSIGGAILKNRLFFFNAFQSSDEDLGNLVAPKTRHSYFQSDHLKITYDASGTNRYDLSAELNPGIQYRTGYQSSETSLESESQQRVTLYHGNLKNTRTLRGRIVLETMALFHTIGQAGPPDARLYHPKGSYTGALRTKDFVNTFTRQGRFTTGPRFNYSGWSEKRLRFSEKFIYQSSNHNLRMGGEYSRTWGEVWSTHLVRNFTDQRQTGGALTRTDFTYGRPNLDGDEVAVYIQDGWKLARGVLLEAGFRLDGQSRVHDIDNAAPRMGLTIDPTGTGKNRLYANWGFFYEFVPGTAYTNGESTIVQRLYRVENPDANFNGRDVLQNEFRSRRTPGLAAPLVHSWSVGYDHLLPGQFKVGVTYAGNRQKGRFTSLRSSTEDFFNNDGRVSYRGLEINWRRPFQKGFEISGNYTWSRTLGDTPDSVTALQRPFRYSTMDWHEPHVMNLIGMVDIFGFVATPKYSFNSGRRYSITPPAVGVNVQYVDKQGRTSGRNIEVMQDTWKVDLTVSRRFATENWRISPTFQVLNLTNRVNVFNVSSTLASAGRPTGVADSRQVQLGIDIGFGR